MRDIAHQMTTHGRHLERLEKQFSERIDALSSSQRTLEQALHHAFSNVGESSRAATTASSTMQGRANLLSRLSGVAAGATPQESFR